LYYSDRIKLRAVATTYSGGFPTDEVTGTVVWADKHSVVRSEFYAAQNAKVRVDVGFTVHKDDYSNQTEIEYGGAVYDVVRAYELDSENVDLTCAKR
jgi:SPP1 family predicted phage head-tail adaptor